MFWSGTQWYGALGLARADVAYETHCRVRRLTCVGCAVSTISVWERQAASKSASGDMPPAMSVPKTSSNVAPRASGCRLVRTLHRATQASRLSHWHAKRSSL